jgi:tripartite ATP-independent transporter DctM subunit
MEILQLALLIVPMFILMALGLPIFLAMGITSLIYVFAYDLPMMILAKSFVRGLQSYDFLALPFYFLAGELMNVGGITKRLVDFSVALIGHIKGGLSHVVIIANIILAGVSGSAIADAAATGSVLIPAMKKDGYSGEYAAAVVASASTIGPIIPPSIPLVVYGLLAHVSVGKLFLAGAIPGVLMGICLLVTSFFISRRRGYSSRPRSSLKQLLRSGLDTGMALMMPFIIVGGITSGIVTPTEAGVVAVAYGLVLGCLVYREIRPRDLPRIFGDTFVKAGTILIIMSTIGLFAYIVAHMRLGEILVKMFLSISHNKWVILVIINLFFLVWGALLDSIVAMLVIVPLLIPLVQQLGIDLVHFGVVVVLNLMIGMTAPPVGILLFLTSSIAQVRLEKVYKEIVLFLPALWLVLIICMFAPALVLWLPNLLIK